MKPRKELVLWICVVAAAISASAKGIAYCDSMKKTVMAAASVYGWGSRGQTVREIQLRLRDLGYFTGSIDGIFGQQTYDAVVKFQTENGLIPDGIVGSETLARLGVTEDVNEFGVSDSDLYTLASLIYGEGRGEPYTGQVAIGAVVLNRVDSPDFPNTLPGVIYQRGAFDAVADGQINLDPDETAINAAKDALSGWDPTEGALYYWNPATATSKWIWSVPISTTIGRHVFGKK